MRDECMRSCVKQFRKQQDYFYCFKSESIHNEMLLSNEESYSFAEDAECHSQNLFIQTDLVYT
jgi:hypothetical protein